ncbi:hypothetical protein ACOXXX_21385 [Thalassococcus sp. BH17M4-6]|uniref:hypothetical protein n=1 Tax=Thalassococcus sp. BH17M4-6 TaxID=3413148 RepID=UPI003BDBC0ED
MYDERYWFGGSKVRTLGFLILLVLFPGAKAVPAQALIEICSTPVAQGGCIESCAPLCKTNGDFIQANTKFCLEQGWFSKDPVEEGVSDQAICSRLLATNEETDPATLDVTKSDDPCAGLTDLRELANCQNAQETPSCSPSPRALREQTGILLAELDAQMSEYQGLLELDTAKIEDEERLCGITFEELEEFYRDASEDPEIFKRLEGRSNDIEACTGEWEEWLATFDVGTGSGDINDALVRSTKSNMDQLRPQLKNMNVGITRLEQAAPQLLNLARLHVLICPETPSVEKSD